MAFVEGPVPEGPRACSVLRDRRPPQVLEAAAVDPPGADPPYGFALSFRRP